MEFIGMGVILPTGDGFDVVQSTGARYEVRESDRAYIVHYGDILESVEDMDSTGDIDRATAIMQVVDGHNHYPMYARKAR